MSGEGVLGVLRQPPLDEIKRLLRLSIRIPSHQHERLAADIGPADDLSIRLLEAGHLRKRDLVGNLRALRIDRAFGKADPFEVHRDLAFAEQFVSLEDVHRTSLHHRRHILSKPQIVLKGFDRFR